jgi:15-cis-phytoene synthase
MTSSAEEIAKKSRSNLAFALACLPPERRADMITFYAFCRVVDDVADDDNVPVESRRQSLAEWKDSVLHQSPNVALLAEKYQFSRAWLAEIIDGVASDLDTQRYADFTALQAYCYKVASVVGLVSARIFGVQGTICDDYAVKLGYAFQLTNIMRDVGQDARETGRIYLPQDELQRFGVTEAAILAGQRQEGFTPLMEFQYQRAAQYYNEARAALPKSERGHMIAARMMDAIYSRILEQMKSTGYQTLIRRERLSNLKKAVILARYLIEGWARRVLS